MARAVCTGCTDVSGGCATPGREGCSGPETARTGPRRAFREDGTPVGKRSGALLRAESGLHVRIAARLRDDGGRGEAEVEGPVAGRGADRLTVLGFTIVVDGQTRVLGYDGGPVPFGTIAVGDFVEVRARVRGDGALLATEVKREDGSGDEVEVHGPIDALDAASVTVRGLRFTTDAATR